MTTSDYLTQLQQDKSDLVDNLTTKGITGLTGDETFTELVPEVLNIPSGGVSVEEKDVNFYDYDGTLTNSYTKAEFLALEAMPSNPSHDGLIAQGWNWSLSDAKSYVTDYGMLNVGQMYVTDDNKTRIYIHLEDDRLSPYLGFAVDGTVLVEWGDGTSQEVTGTSTNTVVSTKHDYAQAGDYIIKLSSEHTIYFLGHTNIYSYLLWNNKTQSSSNSNPAYQNAITKVELGNNINIGDNSFQRCRCLSSITMPNSVINIKTYAFDSCASLKSITIPNGVTSIGDHAFGSCNKLENITMPNSVTSIGTSPVISCQQLRRIMIPSNVTTIGTYFFTNCLMLKNITIPNSVISIGSNAFNMCSCIMYYDFTSHASIPTLANTNALSGIESDCKIIVPDDLYEDWIVATKWSTYASNIVKASEV